MAPSPKLQQRMHIWRALQISPGPLRPVSGPGAAFASDLSGAFEAGALAERIYLDGGLVWCSRHDVTEIPVAERPRDGCLLESGSSIGVRPLRLGSFQIDRFHGYLFHGLDHAAVHDKSRLPRPSDNLIFAVSKGDDIRMDPVIDRTSPFPSSDDELPSGAQNAVPLVECCPHVSGIGMMDGEKTQHG